MSGDLSRDLPNLAVTTNSKEITIARVLLFIVTGRIQKLLHASINLDITQLTSCTRNLLLRLRIQSVLDLDCICKQRSFQNYSAMYIMRPLLSLYSVSNPVIIIQYILLALSTLYSTSATTIILHNIIVSSYQNRNSLFPINRL